MMMVLEGVVMEMNGCHAPRPRELSKGSPMDG
jgi:hypothetical protein